MIEGWSGYDNKIRNDRMRVRSMRFVKIESK